MRGDRHPVKPPDVLDDVARLSAEWIRRSCDAERDDMPLGRADLDGIDAQNVLSIRGRLLPAAAIAVIGEDDEGEAGTRRRSGDLIDSAGPVRAPRVHVKRPAHRSGEARR
jgi:hypothetical protein